MRDVRHLEELFFPRQVPTQASDPPNLDQEFFHALLIPNIFQASQSESYLQERRCVVSDNDFTNRTCPRTYDRGIVVSIVSRIWISFPIVRPRTCDVTDGYRDIVTNHQQSPGKFLTPDWPPIWMTTNPELVIADLRVLRKVDTHKGDNSTATCTATSKILYVNRYFITSLCMILKIIYKRIYKKSDIFIVAKLKI